MMHNGQVNKTVPHFSHNRTGDCHGDGKNASCITEIGRKQSLQSSYCVLVRVREVLKRTVVGD